MIDGKLKNFIEEHIDFKGLKQVGFWDKGTKKTDYEKISEKICWYFGFKTIYEYDRIVFERRSSPTTIEGKFKDEVDEKGNFIEGGGYHLDIAETEFECPICTCKQDATEHGAYNNPKSGFLVTVKCKGCKRPLTLCTDIGGNLSVSEKQHKKK